MKHFEFTGETQEYRGIILHRIRATTDLPIHNVKKGDEGGWIEKADNLHGDAWVYGNAKVYGNAMIKSKDDYCYFQCFGSENRSTTFFKNKNGEVYVQCGCFDGTLNEFKNKVIETHKNNKYAKEYLAMIELVKIKFEL